MTAGVEWMSLWIEDVEVGLFVAMRGGGEVDAQRMRGQRRGGAQRARALHITRDRGPAYNRKTLAVLIALHFLYYTE